MRITAAAAFVLIGLCLPLSATRADDGTELQIVGTGDGIDLLRALGNDFHRTHQSIRVDIPPSIGSGGAIAAVGAGKASVGRVARALTSSEVASGLIYRPVAILPSAFFVHPGTGVSALSMGQLRDIYAGGITNWSEVGGANVRIRVVRREESDSTLTVLRQMMPGWRDLKITELSKTATTTQEAIETVRDVAGAVGFGPYSANLDPDVKVLRIGGLHPLDPGYPSHVQLALIYREGAIGPAGSEFMTYLASENAGRVMSLLGSVPVSK